MWEGSHHIRVEEAAALRGSRSCEMRGVDGGFVINVCAMVRYY